MLVEHCRQVHRRRSAVCLPTAHATDAANAAELATASAIPSPGSPRSARSATKSGPAIQLRLAGHASQLGHRLLPLWRYEEQLRDEALIAWR